MWWPKVCPHGPGTSWEPPERPQEGRGGLRRAVGVVWGSQSSLIRLTVASDSVAEGHSGTRIRPSGVSGYWAYYSDMVKMTMKDFVTSRAQALWGSGPGQALLCTCTALLYKLSV